MKKVSNFRIVWSDQDGVTRFFDITSIDHDTAVKESYLRRYIPVGGVPIKSTKTDRNGIVSEYFYSGSEF